MPNTISPRRFLSILTPILVAISLWTVQRETSLGQVPGSDETTNSKIHLQRVAGSASAKARRLSLPFPRGTTEALVWEGWPTQVQPVGYWPEKDGHRAVRRAILLACGETAEKPALARGKAARGEFRGPKAEVRILDKRYESMMPWEVNELVLKNGSDTLGLRVGLKLEQGGYHWWQWVRMEIIEDGPVCRTIRVKGAIPVYWERHESAEAKETTRTGGWATYPWLHKHNSIQGEIVARCFANGVIELFVRHVNGRFFTEGGLLKGVTPVIGFQAAGGDWPEKAEPVTGRRRWTWQGAALDLADAAHLVSDEHPGRAWRDGGICIYQPYEGVEPLAGGPAKERTGDEYLTRTERHEIPRGMGRTVRMVASLGPVEPDLAVYTLPDWWYGLSEDLSESSLLPVRDKTAVTVEKAVDYYRKSHHEGCFDDGAIPRGGYRGEPGWEGEAPYAQMLAAYLTGEAVDYDLALRSAYHEADVAVDKAIYAVRMHGYPPPAQSLPMQRTLGLVAAYLETGDPYLLETAQSVTENAYWWDRQNWPRRSFGRDAAYIRGLIHLYRYRGDRHHLEKAREALRRLASCQLADGSFHDQGGTTGICSAVNLIVKPWMGCIAVEAMVDFLGWEDDEVIRQSALKYCRWLLECRVQGENGRHWVYQVSFIGGKTYYKFDGTPTPLGTGQWHVEYLAKLLGWASLETGDGAFYEAWLEAYQCLGAETPQLWDHGANKIVTNLPAQRQKLWQARYTPQGVVVQPRTDLAPDLDEAIVSSPDGPIRVTAQRSSPKTDK